MTDPSLSLPRHPAPGSVPSSPEMMSLSATLTLLGLLAGLPMSAQTMVQHTGTMKSATTGAAATTTFSYTGAKTTYTVPAWATTLIITAKGAQGGSNTAYNTTGGYGAVLTGTFTVTGGSVLNLLVGGAGANAKGSPSGGGGSFVATSGNVPLLVAGGGGGSGSTYSAATVNASLTTSGNAG